MWQVTALAAGGSSASTHCARMQVTVSKCSNYVRRHAHSECASTKSTALAYKSTDLQVGTTIVEHCKPWLTTGLHLTHLPLQLDKLRCCPGIIGTAPVSACLWICGSNRFWQVWLWTVAFVFYIVHLQLDSEQQKCDYCNWLRRCPVEQPVACDESPLTEVPNSCLALFPSFKRMWPSDFSCRSIIEKRLLWSQF